MKKLNKVLVMVLAVIMTLAMSASVFAQTEATGKGGKASITINNPAKGETYRLYKLFDATVSEDGQISYQGTVPAGLSAYFKADANGYISPIGEIVVTDASGKVTGTKMTDNLKADLETWAGSATVTAFADSNGDPELVFTQLPYGYYVMVTTHKSDKVGDAEAKSLISVTSTKPDATINDKNVNKPSADKEADGVAYNIGDTITYKAIFDAPNYMPKPNGKDGEFEQVVSYTIKDTLPSFLSNVQVTKVEIKQPGVDKNVELDTTDLQFGATTKSFDVPWVDEWEDNNVPNETHKYTSTYKAGSQIIVTYTAKLTAEASVGAGNVNKVSIMPNVDRGNDTPPEPYQTTDEWNDDATIYTHAAALQKKANSEEGDNLAGAEFSFKGLIVTGAPGFYTVVSYDPKSTADGTVMKCDADGKLVIAGVAADSAKPVKLVGTETKAPEGFNKIEGTFELTTIVMSTETTTDWGNKTTYYDADGNIVDEVTTGGSSITRKEITSISDIPATSIQKVVNKQGVELPGTGGIGTTIFYILGSLLVVGCGIVLISRKRMENNK